jgi:hypothetical protein
VQSLLAAMHTGVQAARCSAALVEPASNAATVLDGLQLAMRPEPENSGSRH